MGFSRTVEALRVFDETLTHREIDWAQARDECDVLSCLKADAEALDKVRRAFFEDTKDRNNWDSVKVVDLEFMRRMAGKES